MMAPRVGLLEQALWGDVQWELPSAQFQHTPHAGVCACSRQPPTGLQILQNWGSESSILVVLSLVPSLALQKKHHRKLST